MKASAVRVGDLMFSGEDIYIVAAVSDGPSGRYGVTLIGLPGGNRFSETVPVEHLPMQGGLYELTPDQLEHLCGGYSDSFTHVKRGDYSITVQYKAVVETIKRVEVK